MHQELEQIKDKLSEGYLAEFVLEGGSIGIVSPVENEYRIFGGGPIHFDRAGEWEAFMTGLILGAKDIAFHTKEETLLKAGQGYFRRWAK
jgi:hypothetical protein